MEDTNNQQGRVLILWIVTASSNEHRGPLRISPDLVTATYAYDQVDAKAKLQSWFMQHPERPYHSFMECPQGFLMGAQAWLPGHIPDKI
jgi:hypothetical protein